MTPEAIQAVERFVGAWADPAAAYHVAPRLNLNLAEALAHLLAEMGEPEVATQWLIQQEAQPHPLRPLEVFDLDPPDVARG